MRSPGNAEVFWAQKNIATTAEAKIGINHFIFSPYNKLDSFSNARIRPHLENSALCHTSHSLTCVVDDERHTDHRSESYSGAGRETWPDAGRIRADQKDPWPRAKLHRTRDLFGDVERALLV